MLSNLYHADEVCGTATVGSSEAILLGGLAMKRRWQERNKDAGKTPSGKPNMVCSSAVHVCWEKLFNYFDIEARYVNLTEDCFVAPPEKARARAQAPRARARRGRLARLRRKCVLRAHARAQARRTVPPRALVASKRSRDTAGHDTYVAALCLRCTPFVELRMRMLQRCALCTNAGLLGTVPA
jgi:hypothetical protein